MLERYSCDPKVVRRDRATFGTEIAVDGGIVLSSSLVCHNDGNARRCQELLQFPAILLLTRADGESGEQFANHDAAEQELRCPLDNVQGAWQPPA